MNSIEIKENEDKKPRTVLKILIVAAILIILVFLSIGIVRVVPKALNSLASASLSIGGIFSGDDSGATNTNGQTNGANSSTASSTNSTGGFSIRDLTNGTAGNIGNGSTINYVPPAATNTPSTSNNSQNTNTNSNSNTNTNTNTSGANYQPANTYRTVGPSDIAVSVISQGIISKTTGQFIATNSFTTNDIVVVKFKIENRGAYATGQWSARVEMPSNDSSDRTRTLGPVGSLNAGVAITGEARFDNPMSGNQNVVVTVDTTNSTQDINRSNNVLTVPIYVTGTNTGGNPGGTYGTAADLQVRVISTGSVNAYGQYVPNTQARYGEKVAVQFEVTNYGGTFAPAWSWTTNATGAISNTYNYPSEAGLAPGASTRLVVGFDTYNTYGSNYNYGYGNYYGNNNYNNCSNGPYDIYTGQYIGNNCSSYNNSYYYGNNPGVYGGNGGNTIYFTINVDTGNNVYESNESNNTASVNVSLY